MHRYRSGMRHKRFFFFLLFPLVFSALAGVVMMLWNAILPEVAEVRRLTFWQALGLLILCRILFGNFGGRRRRGWRRPPWASSSQAGASPWSGAASMRERWMNMSQEEKARFKEEWKKRCGKPRWGDRSGGMRPD